ncbi:MAG: alpha/beta fold hydrolase [Actinomycetota bacterium]
MRTVESLVDIGDTKLFVSERGEASGFPLIVLHGGPGLDHHEFADYLDPLTSRGVRLLLVDQRSQGRSAAAPTSTWTISQMSDDVVALALALGLTEHAVLGHSFGALVCLQHAFDHADQSAINIVSSGFPSLRFLAGVEEAIDSLEPEDLRERVRKSMTAEALIIETQEQMQTLLNDLYPFHFADPRDPRIEGFIERSKDAVYNPQILRVMSETGYGGYNLEDRLSEVSRPMLVLAGRHDRVCTVEAAEAIAKGASAELHIFEQSGHMAFVEQNAEYLDVVEGFVKR